MVFISVDVAVVSGVVMMVRDGIKNEEILQQQICKLAWLAANEQTNLQKLRRDLRERRCQRCFTLTDDTYE